jgi:hypothetical protein
MSTGRTSLWRPALLAAVAAAVVNGIIFALAVAVGVFPALRYVANAGPQVTIEMVLLLSAIGAMAGVAVFNVVRRFATNHIRAFVQVAGVVLLLSFLGPFLVPGTTLAQGLTLNLMHVVVAGCVLLSVLRGATRHRR